MPQLSPEFRTTVFLQCCEKIPGSSDLKVVLTWFILIALDYENITDPSSLLHE